MRPNPGDRRKDFYNKRFYDEQTIATPAKLPEPSLSKLEPASDRILGLIPAFANTAEIEPFRPAFLGFSPIITPGADNSHLNSYPAYCMAHNDTYLSASSMLFPIWGITQEYITKTKPGYIRMTGVSWLDVTGVETVEGNGNSYDLFNRKLWSTYGGRAEVIVQNTPWTLVNLVAPRLTYVGRTSISGIALGASGDVTLYERTDYSFTPTSTVISAIAWPSAIVGQQYVEVGVRGGRLVAMELC